MAIATFSKFADFKKHLYSLSSSFDEKDIIDDSFLLDKDEKKKIEIYYAPFEHVNKDAKIVIVGITPGLHQMKKSFSTVLELKDKGLEEEEILHEVKKKSSFEGTMRKNLISMLDELNLHSYIGLTSTSELFDKASHLFQTTSVITYPVFYNGNNFNGSTPNILKTDLLKKYVIQGFAKEMAVIKNPLIIPLGVNVSNVLDYLVDNNYIEPHSILNGFPHPSGGNGHRFKQFAENKVKMAERIQDYFGVKI